MFVKQRLLYKYYIKKYLKKKQTLIKIISFNYSTVAKLGYFASVIMNTLHHYLEPIILVPIFLFQVNSLYTSWTTTYSPPSFPFLSNKIGEQNCKPLLNQSAFVRSICLQNDRVRT